jgi:hypothetical protein
MHHIAGRAMAAVVHFQGNQGVLLVLKSGIDALALHWIEQAKLQLDNQLMYSADISLLSYHGFDAVDSSRRFEGNKLPCFNMQHEMHCILAQIVIKATSMSWTPWQLC